MNIQIFGSKKDNETKKAQRFFKERGILYVTEYSDWKARIQKNYEQQKENEDFCHFLVQKKRDIENLKKQVEIISIPLVVLVATRNRTSTYEWSDENEKENN